MIKEYISIENTTLVPVGDDLSYNEWFQNVSNERERVRYVWKPRVVR